MDEISAWLSNNPWISILSLVIGLISFVFMIIIYKKTKKIKLPQFKMYTHKLIKDSVSNLEKLDIKYEGEKITNFSFSGVTFWNAGSDTIHLSDIARVDPLRIVIKGDNNILGVPDVYCNNEASGFACEISDDRKEIRFYFDYLDQNDGGRITFYHTGGGGEELEVCGTIKGVKMLNAPTKNKILLWFGKVIGNILMYVSPIAILVIVLYVGKDVIEAIFLKPFILSFLIGSILKALGLIIVGMVFFVALATMDWDNEAKLPSTLVNIEDDIAH
ncbi:MAG: hypothetical protein ABIH66_13535 [bacterium]